jgi:hypothetical protein
LTEAERKRNSRARQSAAAAELSRRQDAEYRSQRRETQLPDVAAQISQQNTTQRRTQRSQLTPDQIAPISQQNAANMRLQRSQLTPDQATQIRQQDATQQRQARSQRNREEANRRRELHAAYQRNLRQQAAIRQAEEAHRRHERCILPNVNRGPNPEDQPLFDEDSVPEHSVGPFTFVCKFCEAVHFEGERTRSGNYTSCCRKGKLQLPDPPRPFPTWMREALTRPTNIFHNILRPLSRQLNAAVSFVSLGANRVEPPGNGPYCYQINGTVHHTMRTLDVPGTDKTYAQLYFMDNEAEANDIRMNHPANSKLNRNLLELVVDEIVNYNHYAVLFKMMREKIREAEEAGKNTRDCHLEFNEEFNRATLPDVHPGRLNSNVAPNQVAAVFVLENDGVPNFHRNFAVYARENAAADAADPNRERRDAVLYHTSPHCDPMTYPLMFPYGDPGWNTQWRSDPYPGAGAPNTRRFTLLQFKAAMIQVRHKVKGWRPIVDYGPLFQQFLVDSNLQVESNDLDWVRLNQVTLWANRYFAMNRAVERRALQMGVQAVPSIILPSSFTGSNRAMRQNCNDAMAIFGNFGSPDLFITMTCNPMWKEIQDNLQPGQKAHDRPDLVCRVFKLKLYELLAELKAGLFGPVVAYVYTIEFQKRGLPHAHILATLQNGYKPVDKESIDRIVTADWPDAKENPRLYAIVAKMMIHKCSKERCLDGNNRCSKGFPKKTAFETKLVPNNYPNYRRLPGCSMVVCYNAYLLLKYNCHINVEIITGLKGAIKYIYKYVFKGFDVAALKFNKDGCLIRDEVKNYISCRYLSAPEAVWRLLEFPMHGRSHAVTRLAIHLENPTEIEFDDTNFEDDAGEQLDVPEEANIADTMLLAFFKLCQTDVAAQQLIYPQVPTHYTWNSQARQWRPRLQRGDRMVARIYAVSIVSREKFALRMLLLHVRGPQGYAQLRNVNGVQYDTFHEAAMAMGLVRNDDIFHATFMDLAKFNLPPQFRQIFGTMLINFVIADALEFWMAYRDEMTADFLRFPEYQNASQDTLRNLALFALNERFKLTGRTNRTFGLPMPIGDAPDFGDDSQDLPPPANLTLNPEQQFGFNCIMAAVRAPKNADVQRTFVLIGPGGSGKTTLYCQLIDACKQENFVARVFATTGIASTLMPGGLTCHRGFGLPLNMHSQSTSYFETRPNAMQYLQLRKTDLILIDEITMMSKHGVNIIDKLLKTIMANDMPFGGKVVVFGGDTRQLLPVVPGGSRAEIIAECVINSAQWRACQVITLTTNMRARDPVYSKWLLNVGTGSLPAVINNDPNMVEIPQEMLLKVPPQPVVARALFDPFAMPIELQAMIDEIFGTDINILQPEQLTKRAILVTNLKEVVKVNNFIIDALSGQPTQYLSINTVISDNPDDILNFPAEYLNRLQPSGMPPHDLTLKVNAVVMLLRNLEPEKGLSNGTRLIIERLLPNAIVARIISESHRGDQVFITRMELECEDSSQIVKFRRFQYPLLAAYAMTINKSQGQTIEKCGLYLNDCLFSPGQLYVALSRSRERKNITVFVKDQGTRQGHLMRHIPGQEHRVFVKNIVYREVFIHGELQANVPNLEALDPELAQLLRNEIAEEEDDEIMRNMDYDENMEVPDEVPHTAAVPDFLPLSELPELFGDERIRDQRDYFEHHRAESDDESQHSYDTDYTNNSAMTGIDDESDDNMSDYEDNRVMSEIEDLPVDEYVADDNGNIDDEEEWHDEEEWRKHYPEPKDFVPPHRFTYDESSDDEEEHSAALLPGRYYSNINDEYE